MGWPQHTSSRWNRTIQYTRIPEQTLTEYSVYFHLHLELHGRSSPHGQCNNQSESQSLAWSAGMVPQRIQDATEITLVEIIITIIIITTSSSLPLYNRMDRQTSITTWIHTLFIYSKDAYTITLLWNLHVSIAQRQPNIPLLVFT